MQKDIVAYDMMSENPEGDLRRELDLQRSQNNVLLYGCSCLSAINDASLLNTTVAVEPNPPVVEKTNGEKEPNSILRMHYSYAHFFSSSQRGGSTVVMGRCSKYYKRDRKP